MYNFKYDSFEVTINSYILILEDIIHIGENIRVFNNHRRKNATFAVFDCCCCCVPYCLVEDCCIILEKMSSIQQQREIVEQLKRESNIKRISVSQAIEDIKVNLYHIQCFLTCI